MNLMLFHILLILIVIRRMVNTTKDIVATKSKQLEKGLIFNTEYEKLDDINSEDGKIRCADLFCLIACPAHSFEDEKFNEQFSVGKNSLFQGELYEISDPIESIVGEICEKSYRPTILFNIITNSYETGYELYFNKNDVNLNYKKYNYKDFKSITEVPNYLRTLSATASVFPISNDEFRAFYWIPVLSLKFNPSAYQIRVTFTSDMINDYYDHAGKKCPSYDLGKILYRTEWAKHVNFYSSQQSFEDLFQTILITLERKRRRISLKRTLTRVETMLFSRELERTHIVPLMYLHTEAGKRASCTFLNTIQVWSSILDGQLRLIDRYLYTIYREWSSKVNIIFGVSGVKTVQVKKNWKLSNGRYEEHNDETYEISIPKLIYRVIEYTNSESIFYAVIVIHNDLDASKKDQICKFTSNEWPTLVNDDPTKGMSYVCILLPSVNEQLGAYDKYPQFPKNLKLNLMELKTAENKSMYTDETENITKKLKGLFPDQELPDVNMNTYLKANSDQDESSEVEESEEEEEEGEREEDKEEEEEKPKRRFKFKKGKSIIEQKSFVYHGRSDGKIWLFD